ncbi:hypothetical protein NW768_009701 [Fusarium equiseti]|uniref:Uncharacterized protein n=1 Tax=Fusarium equiseti TaxID=61235 RepID=A0ABQ8R2C0_FUSEQ|nr:hypothetical protein NW768_009701 [Fusarium equiseti]
MEEIHRWHNGLCQDLSEGKVMKDLPPLLLDYHLRPCLGNQHGALSTREDVLAAFRKSHILQPTFQSFFIVLDQATRSDDGPFKADDIGSLPVYLVKTECTHPEHVNSICKIQTTFKMAIQFVMGRSVVMNRWPSALLLDGPRDIEEEAMKVGWDESKYGKLPLESPSSTWVNRKKFAEWTGPGAVTHAHTVVFALRYLKSTKRKVPLEDYWWWWEGSLPTRRLVTWVSSQPGL